MRTGVGGVAHQASDPVDGLRVGVPLAEASDGQVDARVNQESVVKLHLVRVVEVCFVGESAQHCLEERVYGGDLEVGIIVEERVERKPAGFAYFRFGNTQLFYEMLQVIGLFSICRASGQVGQFLDYAAFHLSRGLVGEGYGENVRSRVLDFVGTAEAGFPVLVAD